MHREFDHVNWNGKSYRLRYDTATTLLAPRSLDGRYLKKLCWSLIGAQGRFRLATLITIVSGWFVTIPLAAFFVYVLHINLQGLVASVTIGYSVSGTALMYLLLRSNWSKRVAKVQRATVKESESVHSDPFRELALDEAPKINLSDSTQSCSNDKTFVQRVNTDHNSEVLPHYMND